MKHVQLKLYKYSFQLVFVDVYFDWKSLKKLFEFPKEKKCVCVCVDYQSEEEKKKGFDCIKM